MGVDVCSIGDAHGSAPGALNYVFTDEAAGVYKKLVVAEDRKQLLGAILVGDATDYGTLLQMALNPMPLPEHPEELILPARRGQEGPRHRPAARLGADLLVQQRDEGRDLRRDCRRLPVFGRPENKNQGGNQLRRLRAARQADPRRRDEEARLQGQQPSVRALRAIRGRSCFILIKINSIKNFRRTDRAARPGQGLRHLQAGGGLDLRLVLERDDPEAEARAAAGHQRPFPRQPAEGRHLLGGAARAGRRDHAGQADRDRRGGEEVRPLHQDHRRAAHRPVRRARRAAAARSGRS